MIYMYIKLIIPVYLTFCVFVTRTNAEKNRPFIRKWAEFGHGENERDRVGEIRRNQAKDKRSTGLINRMGWPLRFAKKLLASHDLISHLMYLLFYLLLF